MLKFKLKLRSTVNRTGCLVVRLSNGDRDQIPVFCLTVVGFLMWGALSDERKVCNLLVQLLLGLVRTVTLGSKSFRTHEYILLSHETPPT
jgi:hypothetical protein